MFGGRYDRLFRSLRGVTDDVDRIISAKARAKRRAGEPGSVLNDMMTGFDGGFVDFMAFASFLRAHYRRKTVKLKDYAYTRPYRLMCASTPVPGPKLAAYEHAVVYKTDDERVVQMIAEGIRAIDGMQSNVVCRQQKFDPVYCRFDDEVASGAAGASGVVFANDIDDVTRLRDGGDFVGPDQKTNVSSDVRAIRALEAAYGLDLRGLVSDAINLDAVPSKASLVVFDVPAVRGILAALREGTYPVVAFVVGCPKHAVFATIKIDPHTKTIECRLNDPNESSLQAFGDIVSGDQERAFTSELLKERQKFLKPGSRSIDDDVGVYRYDLERARKHTLESDDPDVRKAAKEQADYEVALYEARLMEERSYRFVDEDGVYGDEFYDELKGRLTEADGLVSASDPDVLVDAPECEHRTNNPDGWCQTWSAFQAECAIRGTAFHDTLIRMASNSKVVQVRPGYRVFATWDDEGKAMARLLADDPAKLHEVSENGRTMLEWGCALDVFVRCLAVRYLEFTLQTTTRKEEAHVIEEHFNSRGALRAAFQDCC